MPWEFNIGAGGGSGGGPSGCTTLRPADVTMTPLGTYDADASADAVSARTAHAVH